MSCRNTAGSWLVLGVNHKSKDFGIVGVINLVKLAENAGFGFDKMIDGWKSFNPVSPVFYNERDYSLVTFYVRQIEEGIKGTTQQTTQQTTQEKIILLIQEQPSITRRELAKKIGLSDDGIKYHLNKLRSAGKIEHVGSTKAGHWEIIE